MIELVVAAPLAAALLPAAIGVRDLRRAARVALAALAALAPLAIAGRLDGLAQALGALVSVLGFLATLYSVDMFSVDWTGGPVRWARTPIYFALLGAFWSAMLVVVTASGFGILWLGISATTLATAFLVGFGGDDGALEAAWKYLVLCSVGIAVALAGIVLLGKAALDAGALPSAALTWSAPHGELARLATILMAIGFATKAGIAPLHAWLPDAHSKAPPPISALLSGVLVSCALYAVMRTLQAAETAGEAALLHATLTWLGAGSILVAGTLMLVQRDVKRMLAYSTVEHAGVVALALGLGGPLGLGAALLHLVAHAFAKSGAFFAAGIGARHLKIVAFGALAALPPCGLFWSELLVVAAAIERQAWAPLAIAAAGLLVGFAALARRALAVGPAEAPVRAFSPSGPPSFASAAIALACAALTIALPWTPLATIGARLLGAR